MRLVRDGWNSFIRPALLRVKCAYPKSINSHFIKEMSILLICVFHLVTFKGNKKTVNSNYNEWLLCKLLYTIGVKYRGRLTQIF